MAERSGDWMKQALRDLEAAEENRKRGFHEWSCFIAQQGAEKAVKALLYKLSAVSWGHSVYELLKLASKKIVVDEETIAAAKRLDRYYIPTRYPNSFDSGSPHDYFTSKDADDALVCSKRIVEFCNSLLA